MPKSKEQNQKENNKARVFSQVNTEPNKTLHKQRETLYLGLVLKTYDLREEN